MLFLLQHLLQPPQLPIALLSHQLQLPTLSIIHLAHPPLTLLLYLEQLPILSLHYFLNHAPECLHIRPVALPLPRPLFLHHCYPAHILLDHLRISLDLTLKQYNLVLLRGLDVADMQVCHILVHLLGFVDLAALLFLHVGDDVMQVRDLEQKVLNLKAVLGCQLLQGATAVGRLVLLIERGRAQGMADASVRLL